MSVDEAADGGEPQPAGRGYCSDRSTTGEELLCDDTI